MISFFENIVSRIFPVGTTSSVDVNECFSHINAVTHEERHPRLSFCERVSVVLIPQSVEYRRAGCDLWWNSDDYIRFREDFIDEMNQCIATDPSILTMQEALKKICSVQMNDIIDGDLESEEVELQNTLGTNIPEDSQSVQRVHATSLGVESPWRSLMHIDASSQTILAFFFNRIVPVIRYKIWEDLRRRPRPRTRGKLEERFGLLLQTKRDQINDFKVQTLHEMFRVFRATLMHSSITNS